MVHSDCSRMLDSKLSFYDGIADSFDGVANSCDTLRCHFCQCGRLTIGSLGDSLGPVMVKMAVLARRAS